MTRYALLLGDAPEGKRQKKIDEMYKFLMSSSGGAWNNNQVLIFPNGIDEAPLIYILSNLQKKGIDSIYIYICTITPTLTNENFIWLGKNAIKKSIINCKSQIIYDCDNSFINENEFYSIQEVV